MRVAGCAYVRHVQDATSTNLGATEATAADANSVPRSARAKLLERITLEVLHVAIERELARRGRDAEEWKTWTLTTAAHARISRAEADGRESLSPEAQVDDLAHFLVDHRIWPTYLCFEVVSGWKRVRNKRFERPAFRELMRLIAADALDVQSVTSYHIDRIARREGIGFEFLDLLQDKAIDLYVSSDGEPRPLEEAYDDYSDQLRDARKQSDATSRRIKVAQRRLVRQHVPLSGLQDAYGHTPVTVTKTNSRGQRVTKQIGATACDSESSVITEFKERVLAAADGRAGASPTVEQTAHSILADFNRRGLRNRNDLPFRYGPFVRVVRSPRMCAKQRWNGELHDMSPLPSGAGVEPIMSEDEWTQLCAALVGTRGRSGRKASYLLTGHATCGVCGATLSGTLRDGTPYYRCSATANPMPGMPRDPRRHPWIPVEQLDLVAMEATLLGVDADAVAAQAQAELDARDPATEARKVELHAALASESRKRKRVIAAHLDDEIDDRERDRRTAVINARVRDLTTELERLTRSERRRRDPVKPAEARRKMSEGTNEERLDLIQGVLPVIRLNLTEGSNGATANNVPPSERVELEFEPECAPAEDDLAGLLSAIDQKFAAQARQQSAVPTVSPDDTARIWELWHEQDMRMGEILDTLQSDGRVPPRGGTAWNESTVGYVIRRECKTLGVEFKRRNRNRHSTELVEMVWRLRKRGRSFEAIARDLARTGYVNNAGNPVTRSNVWSAYRQACAERNIECDSTPGPKAHLPESMQDLLLDMHEEGRTQRELAEYLNGQKVRTKRGGEWNANGVHHQLVMARRRRDQRNAPDVAE